MDADIGISVEGNKTISYITFLGFRLFVKIVNLLIVILGMAV